MPTTADHLANLSRSFLGLSSNQSILPNGYQKLPSGLILQWGISSFTTSGNPVSFPIVFPTACLNITVGNNSSTSTTLQVTAPTQSGFIAYSNLNSSNYWMALGY